MASAPSQEMSVGNRDTEGFWYPLGAPPAPLHPMLPHLPCAYPVLPCFSLLQPPPLGLFTQPQGQMSRFKRGIPDHRSQFWLRLGSRNVLFETSTLARVSRVALVSAPCELPGGPPLLWPAPLLFSPLLRPGTPEDPSRGKAAASRESTAALKAWLGQHPKNPYPSKGEKVLLAIVSKMSLTQVSTWFANARRRLKKENRACWAPQTPKAEGEAEEEEEEESEGEAGGERPSSPPQSGSLAETAAPWLKAGQWQGLPPPSPLPATAEVHEVPAKPKIWCVAELATSTQPGSGAL